MSHERSLHDGKKKKEPTKSLKEKRKEKKAKHEAFGHERKPRTHLFDSKSGWSAGREKPNDTPAVWQGYFFTWISDYLIEL